MSINRKHGILVSTAILVSLAVWSRIPASAQTAESFSVAALQAERQEALKSRVEIYEKLVEIARAEPEQLIAARNDLLNVEYELATNANQRKLVLQQKLDNAKQLEELARQRKLSARGGEAEVLFAKANRLGVEIEISQEK